MNTWMKTVVVVFIMGFGIINIVFPMIQIFEEKILSLKMLFSMQILVGLVLILLGIGIIKDVKIDN